MSRSNTSDKVERRTCAELSSPDSPLKRTEPMALRIGVSGKTLDRMADAKIIPCIEVVIPPAKRAIRFYDESSVIASLKLQERPAIGTPRRRMVRIDLGAK